MCWFKVVAFDNKVSRRHFLKILAAGATTLAFGSVLGFSTLLHKTNGGTGIGGNGAIPSAAGQSTPGTFVLGPNTGSITNHNVGKDIFCMGQAVLPNGKVLCAGGTLEYDVGDNPGGKWKGLDAVYGYNPD